jgi:hypothetical protein
MDIAVNQRILGDILGLSSLIKAGGIAWNPSVRRDSPQL